MFPGRGGSSFWGCPALNFGGLRDVVGGWLRLPGLFGSEAARSGWHFSVSGLQLGTHTEFSCNFRDIDIEAAHGSFRFLAECYGSNLTFRVAAPSLEPLTPRRNARKPRPGQEHRKPRGRPARVNTIDRAEPFRHLDLRPRSSPPRIDRGAEAAAAVARQVTELLRTVK